MNPINQFLKRTGFQSIALLAIFVFLISFVDGGVWKVVAWMCLGAFIWGNLTVITNMIFGVDDPKDN